MHSPVEQYAQRTTHPGLARRASAAATVSLLLLSLAQPASAAPGDHAEQEEAAPEQTAELEQLLDQREAEEAQPSDLETHEVPEGVDLDEAEDAVESSDEVTSEDVRYAAAAEDLAASTDTDFYAVPEGLPETDGALIRQQPGTFYLDPIQLIEHDASVNTVMYRTTDSNGAARAAVASILEPAHRDDDAQRPVVVHAPGTQGMGDQCAPSRQMAAGTQYEGLSIAAALEAGYSVVIPDYIGLGTAGTHTYMNRVDQGNAVLDAARAAQQAEGVAIADQNPIHIRGYSQGGGAAAAALELAPERAPELNLSSGAAGAVPADLGDVSAQIDSSLYNAFLLFAMSGIFESEGLDPAEFLNAEGQDRLAEASQQCLIPALINHKFVDTSTLTADGSSFTDLIQEEPFTSILATQVIGEGRSPQVPVQINHSALDDVIPYSTGQNLAQRWCAAGSHVTFSSNLGPTHIGGYVAGLPGVALFTSRTLSQRSVLNSCWRL